MGIKHLVKIERLLRENPSKSFYKTFFVQKLNINYSSVLIILDYLIKSKKIKIVKEKKEKKYQWIKQP